ncbi:hypothetical protein [Pendulispora albinea]|uniref:Uncharacterized protein n=1 Tax=Pendulispora albinea TaxID=2741071 RepID=A0ABZ2M8M0_9BACT
MLRFPFSDRRRSSTRVAARAVVLALVGVAAGGAFGLGTACTESPMYADLTAPPIPDGGRRDGSAGPADGGASACAPASVEDFQPRWVKFQEWRPGACSTSQLEAFKVACEGPDDHLAKYSAACTEFRKNREHAKCVACIFESDPDKVQAALLVTRSGHFVPNRPACIWNTTAGSPHAECASTYHALTQCEVEGCTTNCPLSASSGDREFVSCVDRVAQGGCQDYREKANGCDATFRSGDGGPRALACIEASEFALVDMFCGKRSPDGG